MDADGTYTLCVGTAEFGNGTTTVHAQIVATELNTGACAAGKWKAVWRRRSGRPLMRRC